MKRYWRGVASLEDLAVLVLHIVQCTDPQSGLLREARHLHQWALGLTDGETDAARVASRLRSLIPKVSADYVSQCQSGIADEACFEENWHLSQFFKKFRYECMQTAEEAASGFLDRNSSCLETYAALGTRHALIRIRMRNLLKRALPFQFEKDGRFGPGATLDAGTTWADKLKWLSTYSASHRIWDRRSEDDPQVCKLHIVPKDFTKNRSITIESSANQWSQQGARSTILHSIHHGILRGTVMDLSVPVVDELPGGVLLRPRFVKGSVPKQRVRCRLGARSGTLATLDLSNASDTVMRDLVYEVFPPWVCQLIEPCRATSVNVSGRLHELFMYAGMGNATTFVIETLYFWALLTAIGEECHLGKPSVTVFGDDIVMNGQVARSGWFQSVVKDFGLRLNLAKSGLSAGPGFREACGEVSFRDISLPSTYRFYGYAATKEGAIGYCDITSRLLASTSPSLNALGQCLLIWKDRPKAPLLTVDDSYESSLCYRIPLQGLRSWSVPTMCWNSGRCRWNRERSRFERLLPTIEAKTSRIIVKDPVWGPGVIRSWGYWAYKLSLNGCTPIHGVRDLPKAREVTYAIPHRTKVRRRWIPCGFSAYKVM